MKYQWKKYVSSGVFSSKLVKVDGQIGHIIFDSKEEAESALDFYGVREDSMFENWILEEKN